MDEDDLPFGDWISNKKSIKETDLISRDNFFKELETYINN